MPLSDRRMAATTGLGRPDFENRGETAERLAEGIAGEDFAAC